MSLPVTATASLLLQRLHALRRAAGLTDEHEQTTALIIVAGADGCDSGGARALLHYLLGRSGGDVLASPTAAADAADSDALDDIIITVSASGLGVVCTPTVRAAMERLTARVSGVQIYCRAEEEFGNTDEDELFKIHSFIALTQPFKRVVLPVLKGEEKASEAQQQRWDEECKEEIETWPIVQAYGLDELGRHGFFTLSHAVRAFNFSALPALSDIDSACVLNLLTQRMPSFNAHVQSTCARLFSHAAACATGSSAASARDMTVAQANADLRTFWEYGVESLGDESLRAERRAAHAQAPSGLFFFGAARAGSSGSGSQPSDPQSGTLVRSAGLKHYAGLSGYYSRVLQAHPYLPLDGLLPSLSAHSHAPLHALLRLTDPLTGASAVRTLILRQTTPFHDNELEVLDALVPPAWKKKKRRIVAQEDEEELSRGSAAGDRSESESEQEEDVSSSEEDDDDDESSSDSERKSSAPKPSKPAKTPAAKPAPAPRLKKESPGLRDARLLEHLYAILVQVASDLTRELVSPQQQQGQQGAAHFPCFTTLRDRVSSLVAHLLDAKWATPSWLQALRTQARAAGPTPAGEDAVLGVELWRVDAFGRRAACDLSAPVSLDQPSPSGGEAPPPRRRMYAFSLYLHRIPSMELLSLTEDDVELGSVGFGETFLRDAAVGGVVGATPVPPRGLGEEDRAEERRRAEDPKYFGTGLASSSATDAAAVAAEEKAAAAAQAGTAAASVLVLTASTPTLIAFPSFHELHGLKALHALLSSYAHASARGTQSAEEVAAAGLVPVHPALGSFLLDASSPRLQSSLLARPPTSALVGSGSRLTLFDASNYTPACYVAQRLCGATTPLYLWPSDRWLSSSPLGDGVPASILLSTPLHPVLQGSLAFFERGFVFHSAAAGSIMVDFAQHVLECAYFDGDGEALGREGGSDDEEGGDDGPDDAPVALGAHADDNSHADGEDDTAGDALFTLELMEPPSEAEAQSTPYTLLRALDSAWAANLPRLAPPPANEGVPPPKSRFARAAYSLAIVLPRGSALARSWGSSIQAAWARSLEELNIHNDHADSVAPFARGAYRALQEQHAFQRREARRARGAVRSSAKAASSTATKRHEDEDEEEEEEDEENGARSPSLASSATVAAAASLVLPDATCDFLHDYRVHEQMRAQNDAQRVAEGAALLTKSNATAVPRQGVSSGVSAAQASIAVSLAIGTPGSGHASLLAAVREHDAKISSNGGGGAARWVTAVLGGGEDAFHMDQIRAAAALDDMVAEAVRLRASSSATATATAAPLRALVVVSTYAGVVPVVETLHRLLFDRVGTTTASSGSPRFHLSSTSTLLDAVGFFVGPSRSLTCPGVLDQLVPGYTASVVLLTPAPTQGGARDASVVAAVRKRVRAVVGGATDLRVAAQGARLAFKDLEEMLLSAHYTRRASRRRRSLLRLMTPAAAAASGPVPRGLALSGPAGASGRAHFFHLAPSQFLLDRTNFLRALLRFTCRRAVYHADAERAAEEEHSRVKLARLLDALDGARAGGKAVTAASGSIAAGSSNPSSSSSSHGGRIVFTTSSDSLPAEETVLCVSALLKFEDAASNAGRCSHEYLLLHAANGSVHARKVSFDTGAARRRDEQRSNAAAALLAQEGQFDEDDDDDEERKEGDDAAGSASVSASPAPVQDDDPGCPIPLSALPLDIAQFVRANPAAVIPAAPASDAAPSSAASASSSSSSSSSVTGASPLSTSRTSCLLLVYGCALERDSVRRDLLRPSIRNPRSYEKADSRWNADVKRQLADINKV